jgi:hypothetical protein
VSLVVALACLAPAFAAEGSLGVRAENRTGQRPLQVQGEDGLVTELELVPAGAVTLRLKTAVFGLTYSPRIYARFDLVEESRRVARTFRPLFLHQFGASYSQVLSRRVGFGLTLNGSIGDVDYGNIDLVQGTNQVAPGTGDGGAGDGGIQPGASAAGRLPAGETTFSNQNYGAAASLRWAVAKVHTLAFVVGGTYNGPLGDDQVFPEHLSGNAGVSWAVRLHPSYSLSLGVGYGQNRVFIESAGDGNFRSITASLGLGARFSRLFSAGFGGGVLVADNHPPEAVSMNVATGLSATPTANVSFTFAPTSGRGGFHLTTTLGLGVEGFVDPIAAEGYVPRLAFAWSLNMSFLQDFNLAPSAAMFTPATLNPDVQTTSLNETVVAFTVPFTYQVIEELSFAGGVRVSGRGTHLLADEVTFGDWFVLGFLSFTAGVSTRL